MLLSYAAAPFRVLDLPHPATPALVMLRVKHVDFVSAEDGRPLASLSDGLQASKTSVWNEQKNVAASRRHVVYSSYADNDFYVLTLSADMRKAKPKKVGGCYLRSFRNITYSKPRT